MKRENRKKKEKLYNGSNSLNDELNDLLNISDVSLNDSLMLTRRIKSGINYNTQIIVSVTIFHGFDIYLYRSIEFASIGNDYLKNDNSASDKDKEPKFYELKMDTSIDITITWWYTNGQKTFFRLFKHTVTQISKIMLFHV